MVQEKSTHTHLWNQHIKNATLLNDDSPILRVENGTVWAYGSPMERKNPLLQVRTSWTEGMRTSVASSIQSNNKTIRATCLRSNPPLPARLNLPMTINLYSHVSDFIGKLLSEIPFYHLSCLPNKEAALLSCRTIFQVEIWNKFLMISLLLDRNRKLPRDIPSNSD